MAFRGLLVGVGLTAWMWPRFPELEGVAVDITRMTRLLERRGFDLEVPDGTLELAAERVSASLARLVDATGAGDLGVIYLSGHGYRYPDREGDEADRFDESFVCSDRPIPDDWFRDSLWPRARAGARFVVVVDACHSEDLALHATPVAEVEFPEATPSQRSTKYFRLALSACRDKETTIERGPEDGGGGVVTDAMIDIAEIRTISYRDLWTSVASWVRNNHVEGLGTPTMSSFGPDDSLLDSDAFSILT